MPAAVLALLFDRHHVTRRCRCGLPKGPFRNIHPGFEPDYGFCPCATEGGREPGRAHRLTSTPARNVGTKTGTGPPA